MSKSDNILIYNYKKLVKFTSEVKIEWNLVDDLIQEILLASNSLYEITDKVEQFIRYLTPSKELYWRPYFLTFIRYYIGDNSFLDPMSIFNLSDLPVFERSNIHELLMQSIILENPYSMIYYANIFVEDTEEKASLYLGAFKRGCIWGLLKYIRTYFDQKDTKSDEKEAKTDEEDDNIQIMIKSIELRNRVLRDLQLDNGVYPDRRYPEKYYLELADIYYELYDKYDNEDDYEMSLYCSEHTEKIIQLSRGESRKLIYRIHDLKEELKEQKRINQQLREIKNMDINDIVSSSISKYI